MIRAALFLLLALVSAAPAAAVPVDAAQVVRTYPHDSHAYTEGLFYDGGALYESTGEPGRSWIRKVDLATGKVLRQVDIPPPTFGEGIVRWKGQIISLTWQDQRGWRWNFADFKKLGEWKYPGEGWALTTDGNSLIMSDGTPQLRYLDPVTLKEQKRLTVTLNGQPVPQLNELEYVDGEILANVWMTERIVRIDPKSGNVVGMIDVSALHAQAGTYQIDSVANGIAWDAQHRRLFVTGKDWPLMFEIKPPKGK